MQAKVTSKGQVTLPKAVRESLAIQTGDRLDFALEKSGVVFMRKLRAAGSSAGCGKRFLRPGRKPVSAGEMKEAVAAGATGRFRRGR